MGGLHGLGGAAWPNGPGAPAHQGPCGHNRGNPRVSLGAKPPPPFPPWPPPPLGRRPPWPPALDGAWGLPRAPPHPLYKERRGQGWPHPSRHKASRPPLPLLLHIRPALVLRRSPAGFSPRISTATPSCCWICEAVYFTSAARWNEERKDFIDTVRTTEYGSAAGTQHRMIDYINI